MNPINRSLFPLISIVIVGLILFTVVSARAYDKLWATQHAVSSTISVYLPLIVSDIIDDVTEDPTGIHFAVIGDYGDSGPDEEVVADMVKAWEPDFIITTGDNNYPDGKASTIEENVGQYYGAYIYPRPGHSESFTMTNRFFPSLGNHDWRTKNIQPYLDYFPIDESEVNTGSSGNERYYDFVQGSVHFFVVDSDTDEPDGTRADSIQAMWLQREMRASTTPWQIVYFHHAPYSSAKHGPNERMQWPFAEWGADAVLAGHDHSYERVETDGIVYFVNGLGGRSIYEFKDLVPGSIVRYNADFGAMKVQANSTTVIFDFYSVADGGTLIDRAILNAPLVR